MKRRSVPAIALDPSNDNGGHYFMNLYTGKKLHSYHWQELPIDDETIDRVEELGMTEAQRRLTDNYPLFVWEPGMTIRGNEEIQTNEGHAYSMNHDDEEIIFEEANLDDDMPDDEIRNHDNEGENYVMISEAEPDKFLKDDAATNFEEGNNEKVRSDDDNSVMNEVDDNRLQNNTDAFVAYSEQDEENEERQNLLENEERASVERINDVVNGESYNARPRMTNAGTGVDRLQMHFDGKTYTHENERQFLIVDEDYNKDKDINTYYSIACGVMFTQMSAKKGIKMFGERAIAALLKEYNQMDKGPMPGKPVFGAVDYHTLSVQEKKEALEAVNLIKENCDGKIKGRTCADGSKQRQYLKDGENVYSPTCATESLITKLIIDALEKKDVAIFDVPGSFLQTQMPKDKNVLLVC